MKTYGFAVFVLFFGLSYSLLHYYAAWFLCRHFPGTGNLRYFLLSAAFLSVASLVLRRSFPGEFFYFFSLAGYCWMGCILIFSSSLMFCDLVMYFYRGGFSSRLPAVSLGLAAALSILAAYNGLKTPGIKKVEVFSQKAGKELKLAFFSDVHLDYRFKKKMFFKALDEAVAGKPDIIFFGGDILDPGFEMSEEEFARIRDIGIPVVAVLGNHEYYYDLEKSKEVYKKMGARLLENEALRISGANIIGLGDIRTESITPDGAAAIVKGFADPKGLNIVLSHQPLHFKEISAAADVLMFSGHVHKAQIFPFHAFVRLVYRYFYGLYRENGSFLYVTSGAGTWGPPMRLLAEAEVVEITVRKTP